MNQSKRKGSRNAQIMEVIVVSTAVGKGTTDDPIRIITEYWSKRGKLLAVNDPYVTDSAL